MGNWLKDFTDHNLLTLMCLFTFMNGLILVGVGSKLKVIINYLRDNNK